MPLFAQMNMMIIGLKQKMLSIEQWILANEWVFLILIFIVNLLWRTIMLDFNSIYMDEAQTMFQINRPVDRIINGYAKDQQNAPLYFILMHYWVKLIGLSVFKARLFSVLCFSLAAVVFYRFSRTTIGLGYALAGSLLFLLSRSFLDFSHEARCYAFLCLLAICSFYVFYHLMKVASFKRALVLGLLNLGLIYTHYLTIYIFAVQGLTAFLFFNLNKKGIWQYIISQLAVIALFAPWIVVVFEVMPKMGSYWISMARWPALKNIFIVVTHSYYVALISLSLIGLGLTSAILIFRNKSQIEIKTLVMLLLWGIGIFLMHFLVGKFKPVFIYKYVLYGTMGFILLFLMSVKQLPVGRVSRTSILICSVAWYVLHFSFETPKREDWKQAIAYTKEKKLDNSIVLLQASYTYKCFATYHDLTLFDAPREMRKNLEKQNVFPVNSIHDSQNVIEQAKPKSIILVLSHWRSVDKKATLKQHLDNTFSKTTDSLVVPGVDVHIYHLKN